MRSKKNKSSGSEMVGKFFHSFPNDEMCWQGQILDEPRANIYFCQLYSWVMGEESDQVLISLDQMITEKFKFYSDIETWRYKGDANSRKSAEEARAKWKQ